MPEPLVFASEVTEARSRLFAVPLAGGAPRLLREQGVPRSIVPSPDGKLLAGAPGLGSVDDSAWRPATGWLDRKFSPQADVLAVGMQKEGEKAEVLLLEVATGQVLQRFAGYGVSVSPVDGAVFFIQEEEANYRFMRWHQQRLENVGHLDAARGDYIWSLDGLVAQSKDFFVYAVADEHGLVYSRPDGSTFYWEEGWPRHEQSALSFSADGRYAAFEERVSCNGRHPVVVELATKRRTVLKAHGSQPVFRGGQLIFAGPLDQAHPSDSECPENFEARALYSYEPAGGALRKIAEFENEVRAM